MVRIAKVMLDSGRSYDPSPVMPTLISARRLIAMSVESGVPIHLVFDKPLKESRFEAMCGETC
jgi:hypothetical protein